jgi:hypothetical protein
MRIKELWTDITGYAGLYKISNYGRVKSVRRSKILRPGRNECGYLIVMLYRFGVQKPFRVSRLVATHFIPNPLNLPEVNHKRGNKEDNHSWMLEWNSISENRRHAWRTGLNKGNTRKTA